MGSIMGSQNIMGSDYGSNISVSGVRNKLRDDSKIQTMIRSQAVKQNVILE
jgi:hypothetical protein